jgi:hypothetical protein
MTQAVSEIAFILRKKISQFGDTALHNATSVIAKQL